jgi:hypothetical protein
MSDVGYRRCCGMDVHKDTVVVCVLPPDGQTGTVVRKTYGTFRNDLSRMRGWLQAAFRLLLVNPPQVKALQGRKSDGSQFCAAAADARVAADVASPPQLAPSARGGA